MPPKKYRLEDDLLKKTRPKFNSKRYWRLRRALWASGISEIATCEICGTSLLNPQSILIHQGGHCQKQIKNNQS